MRVSPSVLIFTVVALSVAPALAAPTPKKPNTDTSLQKSGDKDPSPPKSGDKDPSQKPDDKDPSQKPDDKDPRLQDDPDRDDAPKDGNGLSKTSAFFAGLGTGALVAQSAPDLRKAWDEHKPDWLSSRDVVSTEYSGLSARGILGGIMGAVGYEKLKDKYHNATIGPTNSTHDQLLYKVFNRNFDDSPYEERDMDDLD